MMPVCNTPSWCYIARLDLSVSVILCVSLLDPCQRLLGRVDGEFLWIDCLQKTCCHRQFYSFICFVTLRAGDAVSQDGVWIWRDVSLGSSSRSPRYFQEWIFLPDPSTDHLLPFTRLRWQLKSLLEWIYIRKHVQPGRWSLHFAVCDCWGAHLTLLVSNLNPRNQRWVFGWWCLFVTFWCYIARLDLSVISRYCVSHRWTRVRDSWAELMESSCGLTVYSRPVFIDSSSHLYDL